MNLESTRAESPSRYQRAAWWCASGILVLAILLFFARTFLPSLTQMTHSFPAYYTAARLVLAGEWNVRVYDDAWFGARVLELTGGQISERMSMNAPTTSLLLVPLAWLDLANARIIWQIINLALLLATLWLLARALRVGLSPLSVLFAAFALLYPPLVENFRVAQAYVLLLFLFTFAFWSQIDQHKNLGGIALGLALTIKLSGLPILLLLLVRRSWRTVLFAVGTAAVFAVVSMFALGMDGWLAYLRRATDYADAPLASHIAYQTVPSFFRRLFVPSADFNPTPLFNAPWLAPLLTLVIVFAMLGGTLWFARRATLDLGFGAVVTLSVIVFPLASEYHYTLLLLPLAVMAKHIVLSRPRFELVWLALILILLCVPIDWNAPRWNEPARTLFAYPRFYAGILLWLWLVTKMTRTQQIDNELR